MSTRRRITLLLVLLPLAAGTMFLLNLETSSRREFLRDYSSNLGRLVRGEWEIAELQDPVRANEWRTRRFRGHHRLNASQLFEQLDADRDRTLTVDELGLQLASRVSYAELDEKAFERLLSQPWSPGKLFEQTIEAGDLSAEYIEDLENTAAEPSDPPSSVGVPKEQPTRSLPLSADDLLDPNHVIHVDIEISEADWRHLCSQSRSHTSAKENPLAKPYTNFRGDVTVDGVHIPNVAIRKKGFIGSQDTVRPSLKIKFDEFVEQSPVDGLDRLTLNNNKQDRSLLSQSLTYDLFRQAGLNAPRVNFAAVSVNGRYLGIYSHVESVKKPFLRRVYGSDEGKIYEGTLTDFHPKAIEWFDPKTKGSDEDRTLIQRLADTLFDETATLNDIAQIVDVDAFLRFWAVESLINFWDGYSQNQNNYFVSESPSNGLLYFIPWGADSCFGGRPRFVERDGTAESIRATGILANRLYRFEGIPERYRATMLDILEEVWDEDLLIAEMERMEFLLRDFLDVHQVHSILESDRIRHFIQNRKQRLLGELQNDWPVEITKYPRTPQYREMVGAGTGSFTKTSEGWDFDVKMNLDGQSVTFREFEFLDRTIRLRTLETEEPLEIELRWNDLTPTPSGEYALTGGIQFPFRGRHEIRGTIQLRPNEVQVESGEFTLQVEERRGGRR